jgi:hypothetical protein
MAVRFLLKLIEAREGKRERQKAGKTMVTDVDENGERKEAE